MAAADIKVVGGKELELALSRLSIKVQKRILKSAIGKAARPIVTAARRKCPVGTGLLRESIGVKTKVYRGSGTVVAVIGPRGGGNRKTQQKIAGGLKGSKAKRRPEFYAHLVERGTKPHKHPGFAAAHGWVTFPGGIHPGVPARPFLLPALDENKVKSIALIAQNVWKGIQREARKRA